MQTLQELLERSGSEWTAAELAQETSIPLWRIQNQLASLHEAGLIGCRSGLVYFAKK